MLQYTSSYSDSKLRTLKADIYSYLQENQGELEKLKERLTELREISEKKYMFVEKKYRKYDKDNETIANQSENNNSEPTKNTYYHNGKRKKKKVRYRKKRVAMLVAGFIGICSAITLSMTDCSSYSHQEPEKEEIPQTHLNDTLTNCMSDAPALEGMEKELSDDTPGQGLPDNLHQWRQRHIPLVVCPGGRRRPYRCPRM